MRFVRSGGVWALDALAVIRAPLGDPNGFSSCDLLKEAGIDVNTDAPYRTLIARMRTDMDELSRDLP